MHYMTEVLPGERTAVIGVSLGAASFVLSKVSPAPDAAVLESMFPTLEEAVADRLELHAGPMASMFTPLLLWQLPIRLGFSADALRPIADLPALHCPVLIASGAEDRHTTLRETKRLFESAGQPKELWVVGGAAHDVEGVDLARMAQPGGLHQFLQGVQGLLVEVEHPVCLV